MKKVVILMILFGLFFVHGLCCGNVYKMIIYIGISLVCLFRVEHILDYEYEKYCNENDDKA